MRFGMLGFGNLSKAVVTGLLKAGRIQKTDIIVFHKTKEAAERSVAEGYAVAASLAQLLSSCQTLVLGVKPHVFAELSEEIKSNAGSFDRTVSFMAGMKSAEIAQITGTPVLRVIPTLSAENCRDVIGICGDGFEDIKADMAALGTVIDTDEDTLSKITVAASCGLGFAARTLKEYENAVKNMGFSAEQAHIITSACFENAAQTADFEALAARVATKGGVTERGLGYLDENDFGTLYDRTFAAALDK